MIRFHSCVAILATLAFASLAPTAQSLPIDHGLAGTTDQDAWEGLLASEYPGYPGYPGIGAWPAPIGSNQPGSGDALLDRLSGSAYPATSSLYSPSGSELRILDDTALANVETVLLTVLAAAGTTGFVTDGPALGINGAAGQFAADALWNLGSSVQTIAGFEVTLETLVFQWDLRALGSIDDFAIDFGVGEHAQIYALQLDQGDAFSLSTVPEPSTAVLIGLGLTGLGLRGRRDAA